jgi:hypothetical protein
MILPLSTAVSSGGAMGRHARVVGWGSLVAASLLASAANAADQPAFGAQLGIGGGARIAPGEERGAANFRTAELLGEGVVASTNGIFGWELIGGAGYAWRNNDKNGAILVGTAGYGIVSNDGHWAVSTLIYLSFRHAATGPSRDEITAGLSFGGGFLGLIGFGTHD